MQIFRSFLVVLWRIWFYILMAIPILVLFPFLLLFTSRTKFYPQFFMIARWWALFILYGMGFYPMVRREQKLVKGESYMLVANHTSMTDIMLMLATIKNPFVFVGKKELVKFPFLDTSTSVPVFLLTARISAAVKKFLTGPSEG